MIESLSPQLEKLQRSDVVALGRAYEELDNGLAAIKTYRSLLAKNAKDVEAHYLIALVHKKMGKDDEAISSLKDALELNLKYEPANFALAELYRKRKNQYFLRVLLEDMEKFVSPAKLPLVKAELCAINLQDGFHAQAKRKCQEAIQQNPKHPENYVHLGIAFKETGMPELASKHLHRAADSFKNSEVAQFSLGQFYNESKNHIKAFEYFKRATEADAKSVRSLVALGFAALEIQKFQDAHIAFVKACELDRSTEKDLRKATNIIRLLKNEVWLLKFEASFDRCGGANVFN